MEKIIYIFGAILILANSPKQIRSSDEYFYVESFSDLVPDEDGNVFLNEQKIHPLDVKKLHFADSGLNNFDIKVLPNELSYFKNLEHLWIGMRGFEELPAVVLSLKNLKKLDLQHGAIRKLPPEIISLKKLEKLVLLGSGIEELPTELEQMDSLKVLNLGMTKLCEVPKVLTEMHQLRELVVPRNMINDSCRKITSRENFCLMIRNENLKINGKKCQ